MGWSFPEKDGGQGALEQASLAQDAPRLHLYTIDSNDYLTLAYVLYLVKSTL